MLLKRLRVPLNLNLRPSAAIFTSSTTRRFSTVAMPLWMMTRTHAIWCAFAFRTAPTCRHRYPGSGGKPLTRQAIGSFTSSRCHLVGFRCGAIPTNVGERGEPWWMHMGVRSVDPTVSRSNMMGGPEVCVSPEKGIIQFRLLK